MNNKNKVEMKAVEKKKRKGKNSEKTIRIKKKRILMEEKERLNNNCNNMIHNSLLEKQRILEVLLSQFL